MALSFDRFLSQTLSKYITKRHVTNAISQFKDLRPLYNFFNFNDGKSKDLLTLDGAIPVQFKGSVYNIPIIIWILDTHPFNPPMVFVKPSNTMQIKPGRNVDSNGKVDIPYLRDWRYPQSDLLGLIQILVIVFGEEPPVFYRAAPAAQSRPPYPVAGTSPYQFLTPHPMQDMAGANQVLKNALSKYRYADIAKRDVTNAISQFKDLRPSQDCFTFNDRTNKNLLNLDGTIPVQYKGSEYNIPIGIWILDTHPYNPPMVFVKPTNTMQIKPGRNVDSNGKVDLTYLRDWRYPQSDLLGLIQILVIVFGEEPPVFYRAAPAAQSRPPYPVAGTSPYQFLTPHPMQESTDQLTKTTEMDPRYSAQDVLLCDLCQTDSLQSYCELCHLNLCIVCVGKHLSDSSKRHNVVNIVPYRYKTSTPN